MKQLRGQKEINTAVNSTIQSVLLNKQSTNYALDELVKSLSNFEE